MIRHGLALSAALTLGAMAAHAENTISPDGLSASTHTLPPSVLAGYLKATFGCEVALLGIQPASDDIGSPLSEPVCQAVRTVAQALQEIGHLCGGYS